ncbi:diguanylate cyclase domain-containing protein [Chitinibacteraceae bacterium HSL-7]
MHYATVHAIGSTSYLVFLVLFIWLSRLPRVSEGASWWAAALAFALLARLTLLLLVGVIDPAQLFSVYASINVLEKACFFVGLLRCFKLAWPVRSVWLATALVEAWLLLAWLAAFSTEQRSAGVAVFNAALLGLSAWLLFKRRDEQPYSWLLLASAASALLALHWLTAFIIATRFPGWLVQGYLLGTLLVMVQYFSLLAAVMQRVQQQLMDAEANALDLAFHDQLTGLNNKRYMSSLFEQALVLATRPHQLVAVLYLDLDDFKPINDTAGHAVGDEVLRVVAKRLTDATRSTDICARLGGDEFVVICTQLEHAEQAKDVAQKLIDTLSQAVVVGDKAHVLGASVGVSLYPSHGQSLSTLLERADEAMYHAKRSGKNSCVVYGEGSMAASS